MKAFLRTGLFLALLASVLVVGWVWAEAEPSSEFVPPTECIGSGTEQYCGSTFAELSSKVLSPVPNPLDGSEPEFELNLYRDGRKPWYRSGWRLLAKRLKAAAIRSVTDRSDWTQHMMKLVHPIGICLTGEWRMKHEFDFDGAFKNGFNGLFIGRASSAAAKAGKFQAQIKKIASRR